MLVLLRTATARHCPTTVHVALPLLLSATAQETPRRPCQVSPRFPAQCRHRGPAGEHPHLGLAALTRLPSPIYSDEM